MIIQKKHMPKNLSSRAVRLTTTVPYKVRSSDESESCSRNVTETSPDVWRTRQSEAWLEFVFDHRYVVEGFYIQWWSVSHADDIFAESSVDPTQSNYKRLNIAAEDVHHWRNHDRSTAVRVSSTLPTQVFRLRFHNGHLDKYFNRYHFGIRYMEVFGYRLDVSEDTSPDGYAKRKSIRREKYEAELRKQLELHQKTPDLVSWGQLVNMSASENPMKKCAVVKPVKETKADREAVRMGNTMAPIQYTLTPRRRKNYLMNKRKSHVPVTHFYTRFPWGAPVKKENIAPKPKWHQPYESIAHRLHFGNSASSADMRAERPATTGVVGSSSAGSLRPPPGAERPGTSQSGRPVSQSTGRPFSQSKARPVSTGTVSTMPSTPMVKTRVKAWQTEKPEIPSPAVMGSSLPYGWVEYTEEDGRPYYHNTLSNETTWNKPAREPPLMPGWMAHENEDGQRYYHNLSTDETTWTRPGREVDDAIDGPQLNWKKRETDDGDTFYANPSLGVAQFTSPPMFSEIQDDEILPPDWTKETDEKGDTYYFNHLTQEATWNHPIPMY